LRTRNFALAAAAAGLFAAANLPAPVALADPITHIAIDGSFSDWATVPSHADAAQGEFHAGTNIPDVHATDPWNPNVGGVPQPANHPDVDLREFKFTHDENNLYAYFRSAGVIGRTQHRAPGTSVAQGRYYVIVTIDVDDNDDTGYWLHEGGYAPTSNGYDMNMELEFYDGALNTGHYLSHDALTDAQYAQDVMNLTAGQWTPGGPNGPFPVGFVQPALGNYDQYTQWVYHQNDTLTLVSDRGPVVPGIISMALSPDGHEIELCAPFKGFLPNAAGQPNIALGKSIDISFSLEASGELAPGRDWASDTGDPIIGYYLGHQVPEPAVPSMIALAILAGARARRAQGPRAR
jgi:hypothetical protein